MKGVPKVGPTGKDFVKEMREVFETKGAGWISYTWTNPATKKVQLKKSWLQRVGDTDMYTLCGVYQ